MVDVFSSEKRSAIMRKVHARGTKPEMIVRRTLFALGYRYRLHVKSLLGKPDIVFTKQKKAIFVHGCFWHGHDCRTGKNRPVSNTTYWEHKLARNMERDVRVKRELSGLGWTVLVIWECEIRHHEQLEKKLLRFMES